MGTEEITEAELKEFENFACFELHEWELFWDAENERFIDGNDTAISLDLARKIKAAFDKKNTKIQEIEDAKEMIRTGRLSSAKIHAATAQELAKQKEQNATLTQKIETQNSQTLQWTRETRKRDKTIKNLGDKNVRFNAKITEQEAKIQQILAEREQTIENMLAGADEQIGALQQERKDAGLQITVLEKALIKANQQIKRLGRGKAAVAQLPKKAKKELSETTLKIALEAIQENKDIGVVAEALGVLVNFAKTARKGTLSKKLKQKFVSSFNQAFNTNFLLDKKNPTQMPTDVITFLLRMAFIKVFDLKDTSQHEAILKNVVEPIYNSSVQASRYGNNGIDKKIKSIAHVMLYLLGANTEAPSDLDFKTFAQNDLNNNNSILEELTKNTRRDGGFINYDRLVDTLYIIRILYDAGRLQSKLADIKDFFDLTFPSKAFFNSTFPASTVDRGDYFDCYYNTAEETQNFGKNKPSTSTKQEPLKDQPTATAPQIYTSSNNSPSFFEQPLACNENNGKNPDFITKPTEFSFYDS